jgi:type I restriction enzyme S subunit
MDPEGWTSACLGTVARITMGQAPPSSDVAESGDGLPFIQGNAEFGFRHPAPQKVCRVPLKVAEIGDVLVSVRAPVGALNMADRGLAIGRGLAAIRLQGLDREFGWHAIAAAAVQLRRVAQGSTFEAVNRDALEAMVLPRPPLAEQRKIAAILSSVDETIEKTEGVIAQLDVVKKAMLEGLLTRGIPGRHSRFKQTQIGDVPEAWDVKTVGALGEVQTGLAKNKNNGVGHAAEVPYLSVANVQDGWLDLDHVKRVKADVATIERFRLLIGDVLFCEGGDADKVGRGTVWPGGLDPCLHQNHVFAVRPDSRRLLPEFLSAYRSGSRGRRYFLDCSKQTTNLASINSSQLRAMPLALPPITEQSEIVHAMDAIFQRIEAERTCLTVLRKAKTALSGALLTGHVRVPA